ncbi:MAG: hypothetical protein ACRYG4_04755 [Janthinobacterium lividum]
MNPITLFYSWQSDLPPAIGERFIQLALEEACAAVTVETGRVITIDRDTLDVPGTPPITMTILRKIRECDIFCADMSFVATTAGGKRVPNPNVMGEYGYALHVLGSERIMLAMNSAFGPPDDLPFDLHHMRHPDEFEAPDGLTKSQRQAGRNRLAARFARSIKAIIKHLDATAGDRAGGEAIAAATGAVNNTVNRNLRNDVPAIITRPYLHMVMAPVIAGWSGKIPPKIAGSAMAAMVPEGFRTFNDGSDVNGWWACDPPALRVPDHNPEARWYVRLDRNGTLDAALNLGLVVDDDPHIVVQGKQLEAMLVDLLDRASRALAKLNLGPVALANVQLVGGEDLIIHSPQPSGRSLGLPYINLGFKQFEAIGGPLGHQARTMMDSLWMAAGRKEGSPSFADDTWQGYDGEAPYRL